MKDIRITFRLPEDVHDAVQKLASQDVRSLNGELLVLLREALQARKQQAPKDERRPLIEAQPA